jgi:hypothetical protein
VLAADRAGPVVINRLKNTLCLDVASKSLVSSEVEHRNLDMGCDRAGLGRRRHDHDAPCTREWPGFNWLSVLRTILRWQFA